MAASVNINEALDSIGTLFGFPSDELIEYAAKDPHGGYHPRYDDGFPAGSIWRVEGQVLYALVRMLRPMRVLELGIYYGCSTTHILQALNDNGQGTLIAVDKDGGVGSLIPSNLRHHLQTVQADLFDWLPSNGEFDFIWEDSAHTPESTEFVWRSAFNQLTHGGMIVSHDAEHFREGVNVKAGIAAAGFFSLTSPARTYLIVPSDCGLAVWRKPPEVIAYMPPEEKRKNDELLEVVEELPTVAKLMETPDLSKLTVVQLRDFARKRSISLGSAYTKGEIIARIEDAL